MTLDDLIAERDIERKLARFARAMDGRDWSAIDHLATPDLRADFGLGEVEGRDAVVAAMRVWLDDCGPTQHLIGSVVIEVDGDGGTARSRAYVSDMHVGTGDRAGDTFRTLGDYHDEWRREGDEWLLERRVKHNRATLGDISVLGAGK